MELDNDERIHDILAQKMRHVLSGNIIQPTDVELREYFKDNSARFETPAALTLDELVFDSRDPLADSIVDALHLNTDAETLLSMSEGTVAPLPNVNSVDLANIFDQEFADRVLAGAHEATPLSEAELAAGYACFDTEDFDTGYQAFLAKQIDNIRNQHYII